MQSYNYVLTCDLPFLSPNQQTRGILLERERCNRERERDREGGERDRERGRERERERERERSNAVEADRIDTQIDVYKSEIDR